MLFPFLALFLVFVIWLAIRYRSSNQKIQTYQEDFWEREAAANATAPINLDDLKYITIPLEKFPLGLYPEEEILQIEQQLQNLSHERILNLTGKTNTELKSLYGVTNLSAVIEMGEHYDTLTLLLKDYATSLLKKEHLSEAVAVLEFGVGIGTDVSQNYILLGQCYQRLGKIHKIDMLMEQVKARNLMLGPSILRQLSDLKDEDKTANTISKDTENFNL